MRRRDFVKAMVAVPVAANTMLGQQPAATQTTAPGPEPATPGATSAAQDSGGAAKAPAAPTSVRQDFHRQPAGFKAPPISSITPDAVAETETHFFSVPQFATFRKLCDVFMPSLDGYPSAAQAGAPEFIDFLVGASPDDRKHMYRTGLDRLDADAKKQFGKAFAEVDAEQADKLLRPFLATWMADHPPAEPYKYFVAVAHRDIRTATINSQAWSMAAQAAGERVPGVDIYWSPIDPDVHYLRNADARSVRGTEAHPAHNAAKA